MRASAGLKAMQGPGGAWANPEVGTTALAGLTLLECNVRKDDRTVQSAAKTVREAGFTLMHTYSLSLSILFLDRLDDPSDTSLIKSMIVRLLAGQVGAGGLDVRVSRARSGRGSPDPCRGRGRAHREGSPRHQHVASQGQAPVPTCLVKSRPSSISSPGRAEPPPLRDLATTRSGTTPIPSSPHLPSGSVVGTAFQRRATCFGSTGAPQQPEPRWRLELHPDERRDGDGPRDRQLDGTDDLRRPARFGLRPRHRTGG